MSQSFSRLNHKTNNEVVAQQQLFTFFVEDMMFGLDVGQVLMLGQDISAIQRLPVEQRGFLGVTRYQGAVVPVIDFAHRLNIRSGYDARLELINFLKQTESASWRVVQQLEHHLHQAASILDDSDGVDVQVLAQWWQRSRKRDELLASLLTEMLECGRSLNESRDTVITLLQDKQTETAERIILADTRPAVENMRRLCRQAIEHLESGLRQVLLYLSDDGSTPRCALLIDDVNDVLSFESNQFHPGNQAALAQISLIDKVLAGIFTAKDGVDCLLLDINKISGDLPETF